MDFNVDNMFLDGTYFKIDEHSTFNYGDRWSYGWVVGVETLGIVTTDTDDIRRIVESIPDRTLYGLWTDPESGFVYVDKVVHVDSAIDAWNLADEHDEKAIFNLRTRTVHYRWGQSA
jgi:hypothetical protein